MNMVAQQRAKSNMVFEGRKKRYWSRDWDTTTSSLSHELRDDLLQKIMSGTNEQALAVLCAVGEIGYVPGIDGPCIPFKEFAKFYDMNIDRLRSALQRFGLIRRNYPDDITRHCGNYDDDAFIKKSGYLSRSRSEYNVRENTTIYRINADCVRQNFVELPNSNAYSMYSPRIVLAASMYLQNVNRSASASESNIRKTLLAIKRGPYMFDQLPSNPPEPMLCEKACECKEFVASSPETVVEEVKQVESITVSEDGNLTMSPEVFTGMMKIIMKDAFASLTSVGK